MKIFYLHQFTLVFFYVIIYLYVSLLRDAGLTFESIAEQVGHKSTITTANNYSFDLKSEKENQKMIVSALSTGSVFKSVQNII